MRNVLGVLEPEELLERAEALQAGESFIASLDSSEYSPFSLRGLAIQLALQGFRITTDDVSLQITVEKSVL